MKRDIFISYRRGADNSEAAMIHAALRDHFGADHVHMDVDNFPLGKDFLAYLREKIEQARICLVVIGGGWVERAGELHDATDFVRIELEEALLQSDLRLIPVFFDDARMPEQSDLPEPLRPLVYRNGLSVPHEHTALIIRERLIPALEEMLGASVGAEPTLEEALKTSGHGENALPVETVTPRIPKREPQAELQMAEAAAVLTGPPPTGTMPLKRRNWWLRIAGAGAAGGIAVAAAIFAVDTMDVADPPVMVADMSAAIAPNQFGLQVLRIAEGGTINAIAVSPSGQWVGTATQTGYLHVKDLLSSTREAEFWTNEWGDGYTDLAFSPDGRSVVFSAADYAEIWGIDADTATAILNGHSDSIVRLAWSPDGSAIASGGGTGKVHLWDGTTGGLLGNLDAHAGAITGIAFSPGSQSFVTASVDGRVRLWDTATRELMAETTNATGVTAIAVSPVSQHVLFGGGDGSLVMWDLVTGAQIDLKVRLDGPVQGLGFDTRAERIVASDATGKAVLIDAARQTVLDIIEQDAGRVALSPDARHLAIATGASGRVIEMLE